jgi:IS30 family transposase
VLLTLTNRKNNDEVIMKLPNRTKPSVVTALNTLEKLLGAEKI